MQKDWFRLNYDYIYVNNYYKYTILYNARRLSLISIKKQKICRYIMLQILYSFFLLLFSSHYFLSLSITSLFFYDHNLEDYVSFSRDRPQCVATFTIFSSYFVTQLFDI